MLTDAELVSPYNINTASSNRWREASRRSPWPCWLVSNSNSYNKHWKKKRSSKGFIKAISSSTNCETVHISSESFKLSTVVFLVHITDRQTLKWKLRKLKDIRSSPQVLFWSWKGGNTIHSWLSRGPIFPLSQEAIRSQKSVKLA